MKTFLITCICLATLIVSAIAEDPAPFTISGLEFKPAADWTSKEPSSNMRAAELDIKTADDAEPLTAVFYYFGAGQGGSVDANFQRWLGQFEGEPEQNTEDIAAGDGKISLLHATGTYQVGAMFGPKTPTPDYALLGAVVPGDDAPIFVKLTGPKDQVEAIKEQFTALISSPFGE
ncbi:MAG: hypothetical protein AAF591_11065 [Verrucomicrobiota bacterium]